MQFYKNMPKSDVLASDEGSGKVRGENEMGKINLTLTDDPDAGAEWVQAIREALLRWYDLEYRPLPWRGERDPYRVLVSEMMLIQTTVTAVIPYYERFLARFPSVGRLAAASEEDVLKVWEGLGYYRRARQLQAAARAVVEEFGGSFPDEVERLMTLPGVGRYIAGAVASFAFDRPAPILEANTQRVMARWLAWTEPLSSPRSQRRLWQAAERVVPETRAGAFNQGFMDLGALVCSPREPGCLTCPVRELCRAHALGRQDQLPVKTERPATQLVNEACVLVLDQDRVLLVQRPPGGLWAGFWELPTIHIDGLDPARRGNCPDLATRVRDLTGLNIVVGEVRATVRFPVTRYQVSSICHDAQLRDPISQITSGAESCQFATFSQISELPLTAPTRRILRNQAGFGVV